MRKIAASALLIALMIASQSYAQTPSDLITAQIIMTELRTLGHTASIDQDDSGDPRVSTEVDGHKWQIYFYDCDKNGPSESRACRSFQFFADNKMAKRVPPETINRWNKEYRYAKAYIQQGDDPGCSGKGACFARIETDVLMSGTSADPVRTFRVYFDEFKRKADSFRKFISAD
jgi:hypothetical protein